MHPRSSNKMVIPPPDIQLLQLDVPFERVQFDLVRQYLCERFSSPPSSYQDREGDVLIPQLHPQDVCPDLNWVTRRILYQTPTTTTWRWSSAQNSNDYPPTGGFSTNRATWPTYQQYQKPLKTIAGEHYVDGTMAPALIGRHLPSLRNTFARSAFVNRPMMTMAHPPRTSSSNTYDPVTRESKKPERYLSLPDTHTNPVVDFLGDVLFFSFNFTWVPLSH